MSLKDTANIQRYSKKDVIVSEGVVSNNAYVVISGEVQVTKKVDNKNIVVATLKQGEVFGEMGLISDTVRSASVVAVGDVEVGVIDKEGLEKVLAELPDDVAAIMSALVERLRITTDLLTRIGLELDHTRKQLRTFSLKEK